MNKKSLSKVAALLCATTLITSGSAAVSQTSAWDCNNVSSWINSSNVSALDYNGNTPLMDAHSQNTAEPILSFAQKIGKLKEVLTAKDFDGKTALMKKIVNINCKYYNGLSGYYEYSSKDVIDLIIKYATENKLSKDVLITQDKTNKSILMYLASVGCTDQLDTVISCAKEINKSKDVLNKVDNNGYTALMYAISGNYTEAAQKLIEAGADVNCGIKDGDNALTVATKNNNLDIFKCLVEKGAKISLEVDDKQRAVDRSTWETLKIAITNKNFDIIALMLENDSSKEKFTKEFIEKIKSKDETALETLKCHCDFALLPPPPARTESSPEKK